MGSHRHVSGAFGQKRSKVSFFLFRGEEKEDENSDNGQKQKTESVLCALASILLNSVTLVQEVFWLCSRFLSFSRVLSIVLEVG